MLRAVRTLDGVDGFGQVWRLVRRHGGSRYFWRSGWLHSSTCYYVPVIFAIGEVNCTGSGLREKKKERIGSNCDGVAGIRG